MEKSALIIVDAQRGFMPLEEGRRVWPNLSDDERQKPNYGWGELPVPDGGEIINPVNRLVAASIQFGHLIATTQDWHPSNTAHFSDKPDYQTTWPRHCVAGWSGAELHPNLALPASSERFVKGTEELKPGQEDTSYSGYNAFAPNIVIGFGNKRLTLPYFLEQRDVRKVIIGGLALDYCVGQTALDFRQKADMDVTVISDATRPVASETGEAMLEQFREAGISYTDSETWIREQSKLDIQQQNSDNARYEITDILSDSLTPRGIGQWLQAHNRLLGQTPAEALADGRDEEVQAAAQAFVDGSYI